MGKCHLSDGTRQMFYQPKAVGFRHTVWRVADPMYLGALTATANQQRVSEARHSLKSWRAGSLETCVRKDMQIREQYHVEYSMGT